MFEGEEDKKKRCIPLARLLDKKDTPYYIYDIQELY